MSTIPRAAYIHIPFCRHRCGYCNFTVVADRNDLQQEYLRAVATELRALQQPHEVDTMFLGGGTPTELTTENLQQLCRLLQHHFPPADGCEWSVEANPLGLTPEKVRVLQAAGVNRISLGVQSFHSRKLAFLERDHRERDIEVAYRLGRDYFPSVAIDLIFAVPGESCQTWQADLQQAIDWQPDHISVYGLTLEKGARFWGMRARRGLLNEVDEDQQRAMYELAIDELTAAGWEHYEVSNFARGGHRCRHNETYWHGGEYFAAGPGAARYVNGTREINHRSTSTYIRRLLSGASPVAESETLSAEDRAREQLVFGLRMLAGIDCAAFASQTGFTVDQLVAAPLREFVELGLLERTATHIRLTRRGLLISDALWPAFLCS